MYLCTPEESVGLEQKQVSVRLTQAEPPLNTSVVVLSQLSSGQTGRAWVGGGSRGAE